MVVLNLLFLKRETFSSSLCKENYAFILKGWYIWISSSCLDFTEIVSVIWDYKLCEEEVLSFLKVPTLVI